MPLHVINTVNEDPQVPMLKRKIILTNDQIKALPTTPFELVEAPGEGRSLIFHSAFLAWKFSNGTYDNPSNSRIQIVYNDYWADASTMTPMNNTINNRASFISQASFVSSAISGSLESAMPQGEENFINQPLKLYSNNSGDYTGGHADNTLEVTVFYSIIDL